MDTQLEKDINRIKDFVKHSAEFIAYFELADTKMQDWHAKIEADIYEQEQRHEAQISAIEAQVTAFEELLTQAGVARFRVQLDAMLEENNQQIQNLHSVCETLEARFNEEQQRHMEFISNATRSLDAYCESAIMKINTQLAQYDADHFRRTANDSCDQVEKVAQKAIAHSNKALKTLQWRQLGLAIVASVLTAFTIGLYVSDEWPWELHQQAMNERDAGKLLIKVWPQLSTEDKHKIIGYDPHNTG